MMTLRSLQRAAPDLAQRRYLRRLYGLLQELGIERARVPFIRAQASDEAPSEGPSPRPVVGRILAYIDDHVEEPLNLDHLSGEARLSKYHFARLFREEVGMPPWAYVRDVRLRKARELLLAEEALSLAEIAFRSGFYDQSHFTNAFKQAEGVPPGQYRAQHQQEERKDLQEKDDDAPDIKSA